MTQTLDPHDAVAAELAALFVTGPDAARPREQGTDALIETLIVGHLPELADLWLAPYADAVARDHGPCVLLRLESDHARLRVLRPTPDMVLPPPGTSLGEAVRRLAADAGAWTIRPAPHARAADLLAGAGDRFTVLSSAEEFARIAAYQRIKGLVEAADAAGRPRPEVGLAVLGASGVAAQRAHRLLAETARSALSLDVPLVRTLPRIEADVEATDWLGFEGRPPAPAQVMAWIRETPEVMDAGPRRQPQRPPPPPPAPPAPPAPATAHGESLARFIEGLEPLAVRCPSHEDTEVALDARGRLHVLARDADLRELMIVKAWATAHRQLIAMACAGRAVDADGPITAHVFTDRPARLADLHGTGLRLHVLAQVTVDGRHGWYTAPLNPEP